MKQILGVDLKIDEGQLIEDDTQAIEEASNISNMLEENLTDVKKPEINDISSNVTDDLSSTAAKITELNNLNKEIQNKENTTKEISDKKQDFFMEELKKRDTILERYLNPISPGSMNNIMENSINKIANKIQPIYSFPPTRTENVKNTMRPSTIL